MMVEHVVKILNVQVVYVVVLTVVELKDGLLDVPIVIPMVIVFRAVPLIIYFHQSVTVKSQMVASAAVKLSVLATIVVVPTVVGRMVNRRDVQTVIITEIVDCAV